MLSFLTSPANNFGWSNERNELLQWKSVSCPFPLSFSLFFSELSLMEACDNCSSVNCFTINCKSKTLLKLDNSRCFSKTINEETLRKIMDENLFLNFYFIFLIIAASSGKKASRLSTARASLKHKPFPTTHFESCL